MIKVIGEGDIWAEVVADSIHNGSRITTYRLHYPRFILAELNTHRLFSRNTSSSRAIPISGMLEQLSTNPAMPIHWGINQPGMQAKEQFTGRALSAMKGLWAQAVKEVSSIARVMSDEKLHKQVANRILEFAQFSNTIVTATEYENFFNLRNHPDAQPEIQELARCMFKAREMSVPEELSDNEWHLPFIIKKDGKYFNDLNEELSLEEAIIVSASCCAQVSYRKNDSTLEKAKMIYDKLINSKPAHASTVEHQATPIPESDKIAFKVGMPVSNGISHVDMQGNLWSGNFKGWIQFRKTLKEEAVW